MAKYVFVTGGVVSSLGKGIAASSLGYLLKARGISVTLMKCDPYLNVDPGTMSPYQHGEVYVTEDGAETDLDLGHYERFIDVNLAQDNNVTAGKVYDTIIRREREGGYLGGTVQVIPHVTDEIKERFRTVGEGSGAEVTIVEIGGTVGDIESLPFLEAIRQFRLELPRKDSVVVHLTYVPFIKAAGEIKTKPTQHSVRALREIGIQAEMLVCRSEIPLDNAVREKIALFANIHPSSVFEALDVETIYEVPLRFHEDRVEERLLENLDLTAPAPDLRPWGAMVETIKHAPRQCTIAVVGKYIHLQDAYKSIREAVLHGGIANDARVEMRWVDSEEIETHGAQELLDGVAAVLVPGGFGDRGVEGKIAAARWARENEIPYFGICLGLQVATIEFARNACGLEGANSREFDRETRYPVIDFMADQKDQTRMGGTMRLGAYRCILDPGSIAARAYGGAEVSERHRHRYEFNNGYRETFRNRGVKFSGINPERDLVEIWELPAHPWFVCVQFHPELRSRPNKPHPLFREFIRTALERSEKPSENGSPSMAGERS